MVGEESMKVRILLVGSCGEPEYASLLGSSPSVESDKNQYGQDVRNRA